MATISELTGLTSREVKAALAAKRAEHTARRKATVAAQIRSMAASARSNA